jgi:hypothetical protein
LYRFGLIENDEPFNTVSKIAGVNNRYQAKDVGLAGSTTPVAMEPQGTVLTWQTGTATASFVSDSQFEQNYQLIHDFVINPWFLQGQANDITGNVPPEYFSGNRCLKHVIDIELRKSLSNPAQSIEIRVDDSNGFSGWFNENFNGGPSSYETLSVAYKDTATNEVVTGLQPDSRTTTTIIIQNTTGFFSAGNNAGVLLSFLPDQARYLSAIGTATEAFLYDSAYHVEGSGASVLTGIIKSIDSSISANELTLIIETEYTSDQTEVIADGSYLIAIDVASVTPDNQNSDAVSVVADLNSYTDLKSIDGLLTFTNFNILVHDENEGVDAGNSFITAWNQDGLLIDFDFDIDLAKQAFLQSLVFKLVAYNTVTDESFDLDSYAIDVSNSVVSSGVQQIEVNQSRGYILNPTDQFNDVIITTGTRVADIQSYSGYFAQKIRWQEWLKNINADAVFYDNAEENDNLNFKSSNYSNLNDYQIRVICETTLTGVENGVAGNGYETGSTGDIPTNNYGVAVAGWSAVMSLHDPDNDANTGGVILASKDTVFRITWTNVTEGNDLAGLYAIHRIQQSLSAGDNISELSSIRTPLSNDLLKPLSGETFLKITQLAPDSVVTECLIDKNKINSGVQYNLSYKLERK